jgi:hypothetical protein
VRLHAASFPRPQPGQFIRNGRAFFRREPFQGYAKMLTVMTGKMPVLPPPTLSNADPRLLDREADILVSQDFLRQGERLATIAAEIREACR